MDVLDARGVEKAVVLVAHGLNLRAHALRDLYEPLRDRGATIVVLQLRGHARDAAADAQTREAWKSLDASEWVEDWRSAVERATELSAARGLPLAFLGYSLGALIHVYGLASGQLGRNPFVRQVLLAPALRVRSRTRLVLLFRPFGRRFTVRSFAPPDVRSHDSTSMAAYESLFDLEAALSALPEPRRLKIPTVVAVDPGDELVSHRRIVEWIDRNGLRPEWRVHTLAKDADTARSRIRHYVINERGLGAPAFRALTSLIADVLIEGTLP
jgi:esterase/lipase